MDPELDEAPRVDQQVDPLARGQLAALVLLGDLLLAAAELRLLATSVEVVGEIAEGGLFHQRPFHSGSRFSKNAVTPSIASSVESSIVSWERR